MPTLTTRLGTYGKGSALSHAEMDANWKRPVTSVTSTPLTLTEAHNRNIIECGTGSGTLALTAAATLAAIDTEDWFVDIVNTTSSSITIDPDGSETIDGSATYTLPADSSVRVFLNQAKTAFYTSMRSTLTVARGALVERSTDQTGINSPDKIIWNSVVYDTDSIHDNSTNPSRLTVPSGISRVRLSANIHGIGVITYRLYKNGTRMDAGGSTLFEAKSDGGGGMSSPILEVIAGDYFELGAQGGSGGTVAGTSMSGRSWFQMEIIL